MAAQEEVISDLKLMARLAMGFVNTPAATPVVGSTREHLSNLFKLLEGVLNE